MVFCLADKMNTWWSTLFIHIFSHIIAIELFMRLFANIFPQSIDGCMSWPLDFVFIVSKWIFDKDLLLIFIYTFLTAAVLR